jgi:hypothetical protein
VPRRSVRVEGHLAVAECARFGLMDLFIYSVRQYVGFGQTYFGSWFVSPS